MDYLESFTAEQQEKIKAAFEEMRARRATCTHDGYEFTRHGRCCPHCGAFLTDFGD